CLAIGLYGLRIAVRSRVVDAEISQSTEVPGIQPENLAEPCFRGDIIARLQSLRCAIKHLLGALRRRCGPHTQKQRNESSCDPETLHRKPKESVAPRNGQPRSLSESAARGMSGG